MAASAFGFGGQKCSACSRLIVVDSVHDRLVDLVIERTRKIRIGDPRDFTNDLGALASADQKRTAERYIATAHEEGKVVYGPGVPVPETGHYVAPTSSPRLRREAVWGRRKSLGLYCRSSGRLILMTRSGSQTTPTSD